MNDFKTSGCNPPHTDISPYVWNVDSHGGLCVSDAILNRYNVVLDCKDVTFRLKELDITLVESKMKAYIDNIDAITINGIKFIKPKSEGKAREKAISKIADCLKNAGYSLEKIFIMSNGVLTKSYTVVREEE